MTVIKEREKVEYTMLHCKSENLCSEINNRMVDQSSLESSVNMTCEQCEMISVTCDKLVESLEKNLETGVIGKVDLMKRNVKIAEDAMVPYNEFGLLSYLGMHFINVFFACIGCDLTYFSTGGVVFVN